MMTTSYPHNAAMHPQGMPHGHAMGNQGPNPGQQMPPGMQHVSGPNGPMSQAGPMMGMQPGMGPNAHANLHLQPQQAHMFQQQQQHQMMNPNAMMQQQRSAHQQAFMRQQHQQQMLAQQSGGMNMNFQNQMANMSQQQQMAALRAQAGQMGQPSFINLPPHLQHQMQNQPQGGPQQAAAMAQAQAQAQHQAQQQQQHQAQQLQQQHAIAMSHAQSQSSNHSQTGNQGPAPTTQPQQGPLRPPSAIGSHQGQSSPAPQPTPQQQPQPPPQPQQPPQQLQQQSGPNQQQQTPAPAPPPNLPQQPNPQAQNAQMQPRNPGMTQPGQAPTQASAQAQAQAQQQRNMHTLRLQQQQQAQQQQAQQQQAQSQPSGQGALKLMNFVDQIGKFTNEDRNSGNKVERWQAFVDKFFSETGSFIHIVSSGGGEKSKQFEIVYAALPRYFYTLFNTDVTNLQIMLDGTTEKTSPPELKVTCDRAKFIYTYRNRCQVIYHGKLTAFWSGSDKMEWLQFEGHGHEQYLPRAALEQLFHQPSPNQMNPTQSPRMSKAAKNKQQQRAAEGPPEPYLPMSKLPSAGTTDFGLPHALQGYLEIYETMNNMTSLVAHYLEHPNMKPTEALENWNIMMSNKDAMANNAPGQPNQGMQQPSMPPGARPGQPGQMFMSPAMANSLLPNGAMNGSPSMMQTPSPASHPMAKQQSTSSHTASVNTSPNINNKRRRSTAKIEVDDGDINGGPKVKQSPRVGGGKRMKGGN